MLYKRDFDDEHHGGKVFMCLHPDSGHVEVHVTDHYGHDTQYYPSFSFDPNNATFEAATVTLPNNPLLDYLRDLILGWDKPWHVEMRAGILSQGYDSNGALWKKFHEVPGLTKDAFEDLKAKALESHKVLTDEKRIRAEERASFVQALAGKNPVLWGELVAAAAQTLTTPPSGNTPNAPVAAAVPKPEVVQFG